MLGGGGGDRKRSEKGEEVSKIPKIPQGAGIGSTVGGQVGGGMFRGVSDSESQRKRERYKK
jgi:hypothetical protein